MNPKLCRLAFAFAAVALTAKLSAAPPLIPDLDGRPIDVLAGSGTRAAVLVFVGTDCPISNRYAPELERLRADYSPRGVAFFLVYPERGLEAETARRHAHDFGLKLVALLDPDHRMVAHTGVEVTPEAAVLGAGGAVLYRGRIDDRWVELGTHRPSATRHDLRDALDAILDGRPAPAPQGRAIGCYISDVPGG